MRDRWGKKGKKDYGKELSICHPLNPFQIGIRQIKNLGGHLPQIEDLYQQFMRSFLASSMKMIFHRIDLREVQTIIDEGIP